MRKRIDIHEDAPVGVGERPEATSDTNRPAARAPERSARAPERSARAPADLAASARPERDDADRAFLREAGPEVVVRMFSATKTIRLYALNNRAVRRALAELETALSRVIAREGAATLRALDERVLLNDVRLPVDAQHYGPYEYVSGELVSRQVGAVTFRPGVDADELGRFLQALVSVDPVEAAWDELQAALSEADVGRIAIERYEERDPECVDEPRDDRLRVRANQVYFRTVALMGDILRTIEQKHILQVNKAKRLTQQMVDIIQADESMLVGLASIKNFDAYTFMHSVNVCILSMVVGDHLRLSRGDIARLGVAALFHDIGKTYIPSSILNSTRELTPREWELMKYHTFFGVKELSRVRALREASDAMFAALQHHVHLDNNGYPTRPGGWSLRLFSRIVTVADYYDAMTASRTYQKVPVTPDRALRFILENSGRIFDPFIAKVFIRAMGLYPVGTIVELDTGEVGVVVRQNADPRYIHRPVVELVDPAAGPDAPRRTVDLTERASGEFCFHRSIRRTLHDSEIDVDRRALFVQV